MSSKKRAIATEEEDVSLDAADRNPDETVGIDDGLPASKAPVAKKARCGAGPIPLPHKKAAPSPPKAADAPEIVQQKQVRSKYVFYPDIYDTFDPNKIAFAKDPQASRDGSGEILYLSYLFEDGLQPLMVQSPNAMHSPTGITIWKDGKASILLSAGRGWEDLPLMVKFKQIMDAIEQRCVEVTCEKGWNKGGSQDPQIVQECFTDVMFIGENKESGEQYPPSTKATVILDGQSASELFEKVIDGNGDPLMRPLIPGDVDKGCGVTAILHIQWIFRKKAKKGWAFSIRSNLFQARVFPPSSQGGSGFARGGCAIYD